MRPPEPVAAHRHVEEVLTDAAFAEQVDMVLSSPAPDTYRAASLSGSVTFERRAAASDDGVERYGYAVVDSAGDDPLRDQSLDRFADIDEERTRPFPTRDENAYPHAFDQI